MCSTPLIVDDMLIVNPGAPDASLVALGLYTGETIWQTPGEPSGYGSLILGTFGGVRQIVGHDATSLAGWDPNTGRRLWTLLPTKKGDFNVPTPVNIDGRLLVATENNGTRLYDFDADGRINPTPIAQNRKLAPDTSTPVAIDGLLFGCFRGLYCLDLDDDLKTLYVTEGDRRLQRLHSLHRRQRPRPGGHRQRRVDPVESRPRGLHADLASEALRATRRSGPTRP